MTSRPLVSVVFVLLFSCSSTQDQQTDHQGATPTAGREDASSPPQEPAATGSTSCQGEPWETTDASASPPEAYLTCSSDDDCTMRQMEGCCGGFGVAVNAASLPCIAERNSVANCRAHCILSAPDASLPSFTPSCREGSCRLIDSEGAAHQVVALPFQP